MAMKDKGNSRLGRGLGNLISGGVPAKAAPVKKEESQKVVVPVRKVAEVKEKAPAVVKYQELVVEVPVEPNEVGVDGFAELPLSKIERNPYQPRKDFDEDSIRELAESIRSEGLLQPVLVRKEAGKYTLIAGERRLRSFEYLKLAKIPCRVIEASDVSSAVMALIENLQRKDLNPMDESRGYATLMNDFNLTQEAVAERVGKGRASVANAIRLLQLDTEIQAYIGKGILSVGHAKVILGVEEAENRVVLARRIIERGLSVREAEEAVKAYKTQSPFRATKAANQSKQHEAVVKELEYQAGKLLGTKVEVKASGSSNKGKLVISYKNNDDLERILGSLGVKVSL